MCQHVFRSRLRFNQSTGIDAEDVEQRFQHRSVGEELERILRVVHVFVGLGFLRVGWNSFCAKVTYDRMHRLPFLRAISECVSDLLSCFSNSATLKGVVSKAGLR